MSGKKRASNSRDEQPPAKKARKSWQTTDPSQQQAKKPAAKKKKEEEKNPRRSSRRPKSAPRASSAEESQAKKPAAKKKKEEEKNPRRSSRPKSAPRASSAEESQAKKPAAAKKKKSTPRRKPPPQAAPRTPETVEIKSFTDESLATILNRLQHETEDTRLAYSCCLYEMISKYFREGNKEEAKRLQGWCQRIIDIEQGPPQQRSARLGTQLRTCGLGSLAGKSSTAKNAVDKIITSCEKDDDNRKGRMLSHSFYRDFLCYIYKGLPPTNSKGEEYNHDQARGRFKEMYELIWKETKTGVVSSKRQDGNTFEACATALLTPCINRAIDSVFVDGTAEVPAWSNEFVLYGSGPSQEALGGGGGKKAGIAKGRRKGNQANDGSKQPRCDGLLVMPDPLVDNSLRALVMMEAKIDNFDDADKYQSKSNGSDAMSRQPRGNDPWPLLVFRMMIKRNACAVDVLATVPLSESHAQLVPMWTSGGGSFAGAIYDAVMAAVYAATDFRRALQTSGRQLPFCDTGRNVAIEETEDQNASVFKSFFDTSRRSPNLELIKKAVDPHATEISLGQQHGSYIKMKYVGPALPQEVEVNKFIAIADSLAEHAHSDNTCHGDIRLDNMMLSSGKLIDWDLAGQENKHLYPKELQEIEDGQRHPDVAAAIADRSIGELALSKDHDWHSLKKVMELFQPKDKLDLDTWKELVEGINDEGERDKFREQLNFLLVFKSDGKTRPSVLVERATGSPQGDTGVARRVSQG